MVKKTSYEPGTPSWVDVSSADLAKTVAFYGGLFGWEAEDMGEEAGHYTMFTLNGSPVAAATPLQDGGYPAWATYVTVADVDASVALADANGAKVIVPPMEVFTSGKMAVVFDPTGAAVAMWEPQDHIGAELVNEPNTFCWSELLTRDIDAGKAFYKAVFGWEGVTSEMGDMTYTEFKLNGESIAGGMPMPAQIPAEVPNNWLTYFAVADCDASVAKAQGLGATVMQPPMDIPPGRFSVLTDPCGATYAVLKFTG